MVRKVCPSLSLIPYYMNAPFMDTGADAWSVPVNTACATSSPSTPARAQSALKRVESYVSRDTMYATDLMSIRHIIRPKSSCCFLCFIRLTVTSFRNSLYSISSASCDVSQCCVKWIPLTISNHKQPDTIPLRTSSILIIFFLLFQLSKQTLVE